MADNSSNVKSAESNTTKQSPIRIDIYLKKHPSITAEEFHERWSKGHGELVSSWLAKKGVIRYSQYHAPPSITNLSPGVYQDAAIFDYDGHAEIVVSGIEVLQGLAKDKFFEEVAMADTEGLVDLSSVVRSIGYEEHHVLEGKAV